MAHQAAFIADFRPIETPAGELTIDPVISVLTTGCVFDVRVRIDGAGDNKAVVFDLIEPQLVISLGRRQCTAKLPQHGGRDPLPFEEPVLLRAVAKSRSAATAPLRVEDGGSLLLSSEATVQQYTAQARAFATDIEEQFRPEASADGPRQFFLLVTAQVQGDAAPDRMWSISRRTARRRSYAF